MSKKAPWTTMPQYAKPATSKARKYIRSRTPKRAREEADYRKLSKIWMTAEQNQFCFACIPIFDRNPEPASELHHWAGRERGLLNYTPYWKAACSECHAFIHRNPAKAIELGLRAPKNLWNQMPKPQP